MPKLLSIFVGLYSHHPVKYWKTLKETQHVQFHSVQRQSFSAAMPIIVGYFPIGMAFGIYAVTAGLDWYWPLLIGLIQYSGAAQFFLVALLAENIAPIVILGTLVILNMRHAFYGLPFLDALPEKTVPKFLAIFWLTDEVYSVLTSRPRDQRPPLHWVGFWAYSAWNLGCLLGGLVGETLSIPDTSLGFSLTALFVILVIEQWRAYRTMIPIAVSLLAWFAVAILAPDLRVGEKILSVMSCAMLGFAVLYWLQLRFHARND